MTAEEEDEEEEEVEERRMGSPTCMGRERGGRRPARSCTLQARMCLLLHTDTLPPCFPHAPTPTLLLPCCFRSCRCWQNMWGSRDEILNSASDQADFTRVRRGGVEEEGEEGEGEGGGNRGEEGGGRGGRRRGL